MSFAMAAIVTLSTPALARPYSEQAFASWLNQMREQALVMQIRPSLVDDFFDSIRYLPKVVRADRRQPQQTIDVLSYLERTVPPSRQARARARYAQYQDLLGAVQTDSSIPAPVIVALWGVESDFGRITGSTPVASALATLAFEGRRERFFTQELFTLLRLIDTGQIPALGPEGALQGSWAGAMGQSQFMPSTLAAYGVDADGDGRVDLWSSLPDVFASIANFLRQEGWDSAQPWGYGVTIPDAFDWAVVGATRPWSFWAGVGVRLDPAMPSPPADLALTLTAPAGHHGPAFLTSGNFERILRWNRSTFFALSVGLLSDHIAARPVPDYSQADAPRPLTRDQVRQLQQALHRWGFDPGEIDGRVGARTRAAIRAAQKRWHLPPDGFADLGLLERLANPP
ncbi:MAG: lytic murein transglycosylase [Pseudomonadota bacterium]